MKRRTFIAMLGGAAALPLATRAQERVRRIGALMPFPAEDRNARVRYAAFLQGLQQLGWSEGRNVQIDVRWAVNNAAVRKHAADTTIDTSAKPAA